MAVKLSQSVSHARSNLLVRQIHMDRVLRVPLKKRQMPLLPGWSWCQGSLRCNFQGSTEMPRVGAVMRAISWCSAEGQAGLENLWQKVS